MDSGFASDSGKYDPVGDRVPGNLTDYVFSMNGFVDVLGVVETGLWGDGGDGVPSKEEIAKSWGFEYIHVRSNCAFMSHKEMKVVEEPSEGSSTIVAEVDDITYIVTSMSANSYASKWEDFKALSDLVMRYQDRPLVLMGDLNSISPMDSVRYNETLLCGNGTYNADEQSGEYVINFCLEDESSGDWKLDFKPMATLLNNTDLTDLCFLQGGFYDVDSDGLGQYSQCGFSNPTLLIHMTGDYGYDRGSHGHDHAMVKIDYILANKKMLETNRFHHSTVLRSFQADGASDHYPIEATFLD
ncbi:hypothetical protein TrST_g11761 [Triparma strigata]|uniref:Endonuclease/exonuclease/phosphatase domain-containing protein n=1 Tax=Triparma strigata TaxID=1606541 RepID=A0A9W7EKG9_9STRA|nr:hypothetical protein TrST_g11761 [Triparma strigata]